MKITMYELYGKIYNEEPPKHIRVYGEDWYWNDYDGYVTKESLKTTPDAQIYLMDRYRTFMNLDKEVEILEEEKKIEKIFISQDNNGEEYIVGNHCEKLSYARSDLFLAKKYNEIIDYLESKGE